MACAQQASTTTETGDEVEEDGLFKALHVIVEHFCFAWDSFDEGPVDSAAMLLAARLIIEIRLSGQAYYEYCL